ncbi:MAG: M24 family metallopeptidase [Anaerolineae bacterium]
MESRLQLLRTAMAAQSLDGLLVTQASNIRYLSAFTSGDCVLVITPHDALVVTDSRYFEQAERQALGFTLVKITETMAAALAGALSSLGIKRLGFESHAMTVKIYNDYKQACPAGLEWVAQTGLVEDLRMPKDDSELAKIKEAVRIADEAMLHIMDWLKPGVSEIQIAWEIESFMRTHGAEALSFSSITAIGENGAMAHAVPGERELRLGDMLVIDIGAQYQGYCSDITRSFCYGRADVTYLERWNLVLRAQLAAEAGIRAGIVGSEADALARQVIAEAGMGDKFGHGLGHGVGLEIHERPNLSRLAVAPLPEHSVVTVEPGVYEPGWGGIRIEDSVVVGNNGCEILTQAPKVAVVQPIQK